MIEKITSPVTTAKVTTYREASEANSRLREAQRGHRYPVKHKPGPNRQYRQASPGNLSVDNFN